MQRLEPLIVGVREDADGQDVQVSLAYPGDLRQVNNGSPLSVQICMPGTLADAGRRNSLPSLGFASVHQP